MENSGDLNLKLLRAIYHAQKEFIAGNWTTSQLFDMLLSTLLELTSSEYGFIGKVIYPENRPPYLKTYSITNISWNAETEKFYKENAPKGFEFTNLKSLFGAVITEQSPVISNSPSTDPRRTGIPEGHPDLNAFLGIPLDFRDRMIGMCGIANRPGGYHPELLEFLEPFSSTCATILNSLEESEQKESAEKLLNISRERYELAIAASNDGLWDWDLRTNELYFSTRWKEMLGYTDSEFQNGFDSWDRVIYPDDKEKALKLVTDYKDGKIDEFKMVQRFIHKNGSIVYILSKAIKKVDSEGNPIRIVGAHTDITEQVKYEEILKIEKEKAESASRAKADFLSIMSHEIRTPMNGVIATTNLLLDSSLDENQKELVDTLKFSSDHLLNIINDILDFSKIESGSIEFEKIDFNLKNTLENIVQLHSNSARKKGIHIELDIQENVPQKIIGDPLRLGQIFNNLLNNSVKFTEKGQVRIFVQSKGKDDSSDTIYFEVSDSGIGIPDDRQEVIFEVFTQAKSNTERKYGGTGLGLSITKKLIQLMGSDIFLESKVGNGTKFFFTIQFASSSKQEKIIENEIKNQIKKDLNGLNLLLVEDNEVNILLASKFLKKWNTNFQVARNGIQAVEMIQSKLFDIVLMDLQMPEMDGLEATKRIRSMEDEYFKSVPIIALTADVLDKSKEKTKTYQMNDFVSKPFKPDELYSKIDYYSKLNK